MTHDDIDRAADRYRAFGVSLELMATQIICTECATILQPLGVAAFLGPHPERGVSMKRVLCMTCLKERLLAPRPEPPEVGP